MRSHVVCELCKRLLLTTKQGKMPKHQNKDGTICSTTKCGGTGRLIEPMERAAEISECGTYRYTLTRQWGPGTTWNVIMLNPSVADGETDDPTIRRLINYSIREGHGRLVVTNLFAYRATDPQELVQASKTMDVVGEDNDFYIHLHALTSEQRILVGWGTRGGLLGRDRDVMALLHRYELCALEITKQGHPGHPLRLRADAPLLPYPHTSG